MNLPRTADLQVGTVESHVTAPEPAGKPAVQVHVRGARPTGPRWLSMKLDTESGAEAPALQTLRDVERVRRGEAFGVRRFTAALELLLV